MAKNYDLYLRGYVGGYDFDSSYVDYILDKFSDRQVSVLIDSLGGSTATALTICAAFANHGNVAVHFQGMSASAATIAALGAKSVTIEDSACYLVHKCSTEFFDWSTKNADQLDEYIKGLQECKENLDKIDLHVAQLYAKKCNKTSSEILALMKKGGWLTPSEALEWGFVDKITEGVSKKQNSISSYLAQAMEGAGIPLPPNVTVEQDSKAEKGFFASLEQKFTNLFKSINMDKNEQKSTAAEVKPATDSAASAEQNQSPSEVESLKSQLEDMKKKHAEEVAALNSQIEALKKSPAAESSKVVDSSKKTGQSSGMTELQEFMTSSQNAKKLFNSIP